MSVERICLNWDGQQEFEVVKGHVSDDDFKACLERATGKSIDYTKIERTYARWSFNGAISDLGCLTLRLYDSAGRGRFKCTVGYLKDGECND